LVAKKVVGKIKGVQLKLAVAETGQVGIACKVGRFVPPMSPQPLPSPPLRCCHPPPPVAANHHRSLTHKHGKKEVFKKRKKERNTKPMTSSPSTKNFFCFPSNQIEQKQTFYFFCWALAVKPTVATTSKATTSAILATPKTVAAPRVLLVPHMVSGRRRMRVRERERKPRDRELF
jgi:hypothetical protein